MAIFKCDCSFHIIEIDKKAIKGISYIGMTIYNHRSEKTGKLYKKPIELGTVVLIDKEAKKFRKYMR